MGTTYKACTKMRIINNIATSNFEAIHSTSIILYVHVKLRTLPPNANFQ